MTPAELARYLRPAEERRGDWADKLSVITVTRPDGTYSVAAAPHSVPALGAAMLAETLRTLTSP